MSAQFFRSLIFVLAGFPNLTGAQIQDGTWFLDACGAAVKQVDNVQLSANEAAVSLYCISYVAGFVDAIPLVTKTTKGSPIICLPENGASNEQAIRVFVKYLRENPEQLHESGRTSLFISLARTFPCKH